MLLEVEHVVTGAITLIAGGLGGSIIAFFNWLKNRGDDKQSKGNLEASIEFLKQDALHNREEHKEMREAIHQIGAKLDSAITTMDRRFDYIERSISEIKKEWK